jgi:hypothetical protein
MPDHRRRPHRMSRRRCAVSKEKGCDTSDDYQNGAFKRSVE